MIDKNTTLEMNRNKCPECGSLNTSESTQQNGQDDFDYIFECLECGATGSN